MLSRDRSRSTRNGLLAALVLLASLALAVQQAAAQQPAQQSTPSDGTAAPLPSAPILGTPPSLPVAPPPPLPGAQPSQTPSAQPTTPPPVPSNTSPSATSPSATSGAATPAESTPPADNGTLMAYSLASVPDMIGDTLAGRYRLFFGTERPIALTIPIAGGDGYEKIADDTSPIPTDRVFIDDNYFNHAAFTGNGGIIGLNRFTIGAEKTFFDGICSLEVEAPVDSGLRPDQDVDALTCDNQGTVFGNLSLTLKCLVYRSDDLAVSVGAMVGLPTAPSGGFSFDGGTLTIQNHSVHVAPFVGAVYTPNPNWFVTGYVQTDFDTNGDPVCLNYLSSDPQTVLRDPSLLYLDLAVGYWVFRDTPMFNRYLTGIAPALELHYTTTMQSYHAIDEVLFPLYGGTDELDLTAGLHFQIGPCSMLTVAAVVPLRDDPRDREFDSEIVAQFDRRF